jgi:hypothetical protein
VLSPHSVSIDTRNLKEIEERISGFPDLFQRARRSALSSTGDMIREEIRSFIEGGGAGWKPLHPITLKLRKFRAPKGSPLYYLGRFSRYVVLDQDTSVEIGLGKGRARISKGESRGWTTFRGNEDPWLGHAATRAEEGGRAKVTRLTRLKWMSTKIKGKKWKKLNRSGAILGGYFVLKPSTEFLTIPKRPIFNPVFTRISGKVTPHFEAVFWEAFNRYQSGAKKTDVGGNPGWKS